MAPTPEPILLPKQLPAVPVPPSQFIQHVNGNPQIHVRELLKPYKEYESALRAYYAQDPDHEFVKDNTINLIDIFTAKNMELKIVSRNLDEESQQEKERYIMQLGWRHRKNSNDQCIVPTMEDFRNNFNVFTEGALMNMDWSNIVVAGSAVLTPLLAVPRGHADSKRTLRHYYHEILAPASDIDLFLYGVDEQQAIAKIEAIETTIRDNLLWEITTIRTRNTVTFVSQYPNRHVQIVLRLYKSISQILTGFDVDCSAFAFNGSQVLASPRAVAACMMQCNDVDLTRRSPSYENRLSKYSHRGFEVYCDFVDRSRIDPTIFERSFARTTGLARLLVLEALPKPEQREQYQSKRREEMGRPGILNSFRRRINRNNKKEVEVEEVAEWDFEDVSGYQRFSIPYGEGFNARRIEKLFFKKDLVLNAEWNKMNWPPNRSVNLHRHPVFFGNVKDIIGDCCGYCPEPLDDEEKKISNEEGKIYVKGRISFLTDDPGRQEIGSFYPLGPEDYVDMAYVGSSQRLCEAIVDNDLNYVKSWCEQEGVDVNVRDYCGRTPLQLACLSISTGDEIVQCLIDHGARLIARLQDGRTALHLAASQGRADIVASLLKKSAENEQARDEQRSSKALRFVDGADDGMKETTHEETTIPEPDKDSDDDESYEDIHSSDSGASEGAPTETTAGFVKVSNSSESNPLDMDEANIDDIYDINITDWDYMMSPLHYAIIGGHVAAMETLVSEFGADVRKPIVKRDAATRYYSTNALLNLVLALNVPEEKRSATIVALLKLGASCTQATNNRDGSRSSAFHYFIQAGVSTEVLDLVFEHDGPGALSVINNIHRPGNLFTKLVSPLLTAISTDVVNLDLFKCLLSRGAHLKITLEDVIRNMKPAQRQKIKPHSIKYDLANSIMHPLEVAISQDLGVDWVKVVLEYSSPNFLLTATRDVMRHGEAFGGPDRLTPLDEVRSRIEQCRKLLQMNVDDVTRGFIYGPKSQDILPESLIDQYPEGTYSRFAAGYYISSNNKRATTYNEAKEKERKAGKDPESKYLLQREAVKKVLSQLFEVEKVLEEVGAKTYFEMHPEAIPDYMKRHESVMEIFRGPREDRPDIVYSIPTQTTDTTSQDGIFNPFGFNNPYLGAGNVQKGYIRLFEAVWRGTLEDQETVRMLTSGPSGEGEDRIPALRVSAKDTRGLNALFIAFTRGHYDMVDLIMQIVKEQYEPVELAVIKPSDIDDDSDLEDIDHIVDDITTEENMTKSNMSPWEYFAGTMTSVLYLLSNKGIEQLPPLEWLRSLHHNTLFTKPTLGHNWTLLSYAIYKNSIPLVRRVLKLARSAALDSKLDPDAYIQTFFDLDLEPQKHHFAKYAHLRLAIVFGRIQILEELTKSLSIGIPYGELTEKDQVLQQQLSQYHYQGLSIRGSKKKDWVDSSFPAEGTNASDWSLKPLHLAAYHANMASLQWLKSNRPWECLKQFIRDNLSSHQVRLLDENGAASLFAKGLGFPTTLLPHIAIAGWGSSGNVEDSKAMLHYLIYASHDAINAKSTIGLTPALYAVRENKREAVTELIKLGADFAARDIHARNILHLLLSPDGTPTHRPLSETKAMIAALPPAAVKKAWSQGSSGSLGAPLGHWISGASDSTIHLPTLEYLLVASNGVGLEFANDQGNLPIHDLFLNHQYDAARIVLERYPHLIAFENGNGRTPVDIAAAGYYKALCDAFPSIAVPQRNQTRVTVADSIASRGSRHKITSQPSQKPYITGRQDPAKSYELAMKLLAGKRRLVGLEVAGALANRMTNEVAEGPYRYGTYGGFLPIEDFGDALALL